MAEPNGWNEWSRHVLAELVRLSDSYNSLRKQQGQLLVEIAKLKIKSGVWGAIAGLIPSGAVLIYIILKVGG